MSTLLPQLVARLRHIKQNSGPVPAFIGKVISAPKGLDIAAFVWVGYAGMGEVMFVDLQPADLAEVERLLAEGTYLQLLPDTVKMPVYFETHVDEVVVQKVALI